MPSLKKTKPIKQLIIGLVGSPGSGKTTLAKILTARGFRNIILSSFIKTELAKQQLAVNRQNLQDIGDQLRKVHGPDVLAQLALKQIKVQKIKRATIDGIRNLAEVKRLQQEKNFHLIGVTATPDKRYERLTKNIDKYNNIKNWQDFIHYEMRENAGLANKTGQQNQLCYLHAQHFIVNNSSLKNFKNQLELILREIDNGVNKSKLQIAIDGPIGVGKSSLAFLLAQRLDLLYVYTGAMYRAAAWLALKDKLNLSDSRAILNLLKTYQLELRQPSRPERYTDVFLDGQDITHRLFTRSVSRAVPQVSCLKKIRQYLVKLQQQIATDKGVVMEGRDIGTVVLPRADLKIYLTADLEIRVRRRWSQLKQIKKPQVYETVLNDLQARDKLDTTRQVSPLDKAKDAWVLDTSNLSIPATLEIVIDQLKKKGLIA